MSKVGKPNDGRDWEDVTAPTADAFSDSPKLKLVFPAGILQPPFFDLAADDAVNYGAIGSIIGHEIGHHFDDQGSKFDVAGRMKDWWTADDRRDYEKRTACVVEQFNSIDLGGGLHHNGKLVLGEALGDLTGLRAAYRAYQNSLRGKPGPVIDGFQSDQRFFIAFARNWAENEREEARKQNLDTNPHPLMKWRANASLQNMPEFSKGFPVRRWRCDGAVAR
jgi:predicted metalloendopeptidase